MNENWLAAPPAPSSLLLSAPIHVALQCKTRVCHHSPHLRADSQTDHPAKTRVNCGSNLKDEVTSTWILVWWDGDGKFLLHVSLRH